MALPSESTALMREFTADEFGRFLNAKGVTPKCPNCGGDSAINVSDGRGTAALTEYQVLGVNPDGSVREIPESVMVAASLGCENCGFIRTFTATKVIKWLDQEQDESGPQDE